MIDASKYISAKAAGTAILAKIGGSYAVEWKRFDPATGAQATPEIEVVGLDQITTAIANATTLLANLNTLKTDMEALS